MIAVGDVISERIFWIDRDLLKQYADASGDQNPIHQDEEFAKSVGLPDVIAHGMLTMALAGTFISDWAGGPAAVKEFSARFTKPVVVPAGKKVDLTISATVSEVDGANIRLTINATSDGVKGIRNDKGAGRKVMTAPDAIWKLGQERQAARAEKDFALADRLRDEIADAGWDVIDVAGAFELHKRIKYILAETLQAMKPVLNECEIAIAMIVSGFQEDASETVKSIRAHCETPIVLLCLDEVGVLEDLVDETTFVIKVAEECGWGRAANALLQNVNSEYLVLMDPSTRFTADAISPVLTELRKRDYSAVGWRGGLINLQDDWRSVDDKGVGEVDVLFSYFLGLDRQAALEVGGFSTRAIYYRNADIEFSLKLRQTSGHLLQMDLPLTQDRHHGYHDVDVSFRELQSKKNYDRILDRFRGKNAILSPRR